MPIPTQIAVARYSIVRDELIAHAPAAWDDVIRLCESVPAQITADSFWQFGKDKPCWSSIKIAIGARVATDLTLSPDFASHHVIASPAWEIQMIGGGRSWKKQANFQMVGASATQFVADLSPGGLRSYPWRLFAIRQFAQSLVSGPALHMVHMLVNANFDFGPAGIYTWASRFAQLAGHGWGATTVQHMLTDLGLGIKPDLHLRRSAVRMGLLAPEIPSDLPSCEIDSRATEFDPLIVAAIIAMAHHIQPTAIPGGQSTLREIDKTLMEWSRQGLTHPI